LAAHERVQSFAVGKDQDEVGRTAADLYAEASTADFNKGWCAPAATVQTLGYHSLAVTTTDAKCAFDHMGNHSNGFGSFQQFIGNPLVGGRRQILQNGCRFGDTAGPLFVGFAGSAVVRLGVAALVVPIMIGCRIVALSRRGTAIRPILGICGVVGCRSILAIGIRTVLARGGRRLVLFVFACGCGFLALCSLRAALPLSIQSN